MSDFKSFEKKICDQEKKVRQEITALQKLHKERPAEKVKNYTFKNLVAEVTLAELFADKEELIVIHNMGEHCPYCTLWADGFNGYYNQLRGRAAFVLINNDKPELQQQFATARKWTFPVVSCQGTTFFQDMGFQGQSKTGEAMFWPGVSIFRKAKDGSIERTTRAVFGPGDLFSSIWHLFELLPKGPNGWEPSNKTTTEPKGLAQIDGFNVSVVYAKDVKTTQKFYQDVLGFAHVRDMGEGVLLRSQNAEMTMYIGNEQKPQVSLCFNSAMGVMKAAEQLKTNGVQIVSQYGSPESGFAGVLFADPNGNLVEIAGAR